jgi:hypothetical protein
LDPVKGFLELSIISDAPFLDFFKGRILNSQSARMLHLRLAIKEGSAMTFTGIAFNCGFA